MSRKHFHLYSIQSLGMGFRLRLSKSHPYFSTTTQIVVAYLYKIERVILHLSIHKSDCYHVYSILVNDPYIFAIDPIDDIHNSPDIVLHYLISILEQELKLGHALGLKSCYHVLYDTYK